MKTLFAILLINLVIAASFQNESVAEEQACCRRKMPQETIKVGELQTAWQSYDIGSNPMLPQRSSQPGVNIHTFGPSEVMSCMKKMISGAYDSTLGSIVAALKLSCDLVEEAFSPSITQAEKDRRSRARKEVIASFVGLFKTIWNDPAAIQAMVDQSIGLPSINAKMTQQQVADNLFIAQKKGFETICNAVGNILGTKGAGRLMGAALRGDAVGTAATQELQTTIRQVEAQAVAKGAVFIESREESIRSAIRSVIEAGDKIVDCSGNCYPMSQKLAEALKCKFPQLQVKLRMGEQSNSMHVFLVDPFLDPPKQIIIDSTWKQFVVNGASRTDLPDVFVGTREELIGIFAQNPQSISKIPGAISSLNSNPEWFVLEVWGPRTGQGLVTP